MIENLVDNGFDYIDLGLPSGTLWATCNVGASKPNEPGLYFQWGDTVGYTKDQIGKDKQFTWADYKWNPSGDGETFTKYKNPGDKLELKDDAAHVYMGGSWHIPSPEQIQELIYNTFQGRVMMERIGGNLFVSLKDMSKELCFPAVGHAENGSIRGYNGHSISWSSALSTHTTDFGQFLSDSDTSTYLSSYSRCYGFTIRGVIG